MPNAARLRAALQLFGTPNYFAEKVLPFTARRSKGCGLHSPRRMFSLNPTRSAVLQALADTFVPALAEGIPAGSAGLNLDKLEAAIREQPAGAQAEFGKLLDLLEKPLLGLTWFGPLKPFRKLDAGAARAAAAKLGRQQRAAAAQGLPGAAQAVHAAGTTAAAWPRCPPPGATSATPAPTSGPWTRPAPIRTLQPTMSDTAYECDVLVIGSGAGGGVVAGELAEAGFDVLVIEKGPYCHGCDFTQREVDMLGTPLRRQGHPRHPGRQHRHPGRLLPGRGHHRELGRRLPHPRLRAAGMGPRAPGAPLHHPRIQGKPQRRGPHHWREHQLHPPQRPEPGPLGRLDQRWARK